MAKDPVCGMDVDPKKAAGKSAYKEQDIYFCSIKCKERFDKDPASFMADAALQGGPQRKPHKEMMAAEAGAHETAKDPICGMVVDKNKSLKKEMGGRTYYFCSDGCLRTFEAPEEELKKITNKEVKILIHEIKRPELDAYLVAEVVATQLEGRIAFRRAMKTGITAAMRMGAEGIKIMCAGRLGGAEMARTEQYKEGRIPLHTLRADIDYASATARTVYGAIGVKVWICKGEILGDHLGKQP